MFPTESEPELVSVRAMSEFRMLFGFRTGNHEFHFDSLLVRILLSAAPSWKGDTNGVSQTKNSTGRLFVPMRVRLLIRYKMRAFVFPAM